MAAAVSENARNLQRAVEAIRSARALVVTAGAGMGVDSGTYYVILV